MSTKKITDAEHRRGALLTAKLGGCTCSPWIRVVHLSENVAYCEVAHDDQCQHPLMVAARAAAARMARA